MLSNRFSRRRPFGARSADEESIFGVQSWAQLVQSALRRPAITDSMARPPGSRGSFLLSCTLKVGDGRRR
jgi:hypothetical protein